MAEGPGKEHHLGYLAKQDSLLLYYMMSEEHATS